MVKPMILHGMRKQVPEAEQGHFVPIYEHEEELKKVAGFNDEDEAYVMVAGPDGKVVWHTHGAISEAKYEELKQAVRSLVK